MARDYYNALSVIPVATSSLWFDVRSKVIKQQHDLNFNLFQVEISLNASFWKLNYASNL